MRRNQLHASPGQFSIQSVRLFGVVADETRRERLDKPRGESRTHLLRSILEILAQALHDEGYLREAFIDGSFAPAPADPRWP